MGSLMKTMVAMALPGLGTGRARLLAAALALTLLGGQPRESLAALVQANFEGVFVDSLIVDGPDAGQTYPGAPATGVQITGSYIFETSVVDSNPASSMAQYAYAITEYQVQFAGLAYDFVGFKQTPPDCTDGCSRISVENDNGAFTRDRYQADVRITSGPTFDGRFTPSTIRPAVFLLDVFDFAPSPPDLLTNTLLTESVPDISLADPLGKLGSVVDSDVKRLSFLFQDANGQRIRLIGQLTSFTSALVPAPAPATVILLSLSLLGTAFASYRKMRRC